MPQLHRSPAFLLVPLALAFAACSEPAAEGGCASDTDCPAGQRCSGDACSPTPGGGGSGGEPEQDECGASDDCTGPFGAIPPVFWDSSLDGSDPVCTVPLRNCPAGECDVPTVCAPVLEGATRLGAMRCERPEQCASGRCVESGGISLCLRNCAEGSDCPALAPPGLDPVGFGCGNLVEDGIPLQLCLPIDPAFPARTICRTDCDCVASDDCAGADGSLLCRFVGSTGNQTRAMPLCDAVDPAIPLAPTLTRCGEDPAACHGGVCITGCQAKGTTMHFCYATTRCTQPCGADADCPARTICQNARRSERIGSWPSGDEAPGREVRYCQLPIEGCFDERDCCPERDAGGLCTGGWSPDRRRCSAVLAPPADRPRLLTRCEPIAVPAALASPGQCCAANEACDSNVCVPARAGTPCAGGGVCSVPCDPDPFPDGAPGSPLDRDFCAVVDFGAESYHRESRCLPFVFEHSYTDRAGQPATLAVELNACQ